MKLVAGFKAGRTIPQLARAHNRSEFAVEAQLDRMGLWDRVARRPVVQGEDLSRSQPPVRGWGNNGVAQEASIPLRRDQD